MRGYRAKTSYQKLKHARLTVNIENCGYASVERCLKEMGFKITGDRYFNLLFWCDTLHGLDFLFAMQKWQFINHFPGTFSVTKKIALARNIERMAKQLPDIYSFHPKSFILPTQALDLKMYLNSTKKTYIVKPDLGSQGRGIFLVQDSEGVDECHDPAIAQEYISPYLLNGLKFDLRIYVLLASVDPLRIYIFKEGMARFCTEPYQKPNSENIREVFRHLTNYSVNKHNDNFKQNDQTNDAEEHSHKRSKSSVFAEIDALGGDSEILQREMEEVIVLTLLSVHPFLVHTYKTVFKNEDKKSRCFEILGFDILIDEDLKPWVLEVNHSPSLSCDSPFDRQLKDSVITGALKILNIDPHFIEKIQRAEREKTLLRLGTPTKNSHQDDVVFNVKTELEIAKTQTQWKLIYPVEPSHPSYSTYQQVVGLNEITPINGMCETASSRQRREAAQAYIQSMEERSSPPKKNPKITKIFVTKLQNPSTTPNSNRPTKSVLLLREAQLAKIKEASQKETMFLFSPEYENYLKLEKNGQLPRRKLPTFTECIKTSKSTLRSPITKPLT